jgi:hypothetical protein
MENRVAYQCIGICQPLEDRFVNVQLSRTTDATDPRLLDAEEQATIRGHQTLEDKTKPHTAYQCRYCGALPARTGK